MGSTPTASERLILALDVPEREEAERLVGELEGLVSFFKVGLELFTAAGPGVVEWLVGRGKRVFLDVKWFDIPQTVAAVVRVTSKMGVNLATVDGNGSDEMLRAAAGAREGALRLLCVTALTSWDDAALREMGWQTTVEKLVTSRARRALACGLDGAIASGREVARIREVAGGGFLVVTPGMRLPGAESHDHRRASDPASAIREGADYVVVGRPIREAKDRRAEARRYIESIESGLASRR